MLAAPNKQSMCAEICMSCTCGTHTHKGACLGAAPVLPSAIVLNETLMLQAGNCSHCLPSYTSDMAPDSSSYAAADECFEEGLQLALLQRRGNAAKATSTPRLQQYSAAPTPILHLRNEHHLRPTTNDNKLLQPITTAHQARRNKLLCSACRMRFA